MAQAISNLSVGNLIKLPVKSAYQSILGENIVLKVADKNHSGYPTNSVTFITDKIIALLAFDAKEPSNSNADRQNYGNNRYLFSNLLQWLNSSGSAGSWYTAQHAADATPNSSGVSVNSYDTWAGFLTMLDGDFVASLLDTTQTVVKNTVTDGGGSETVTSKMFLASTTEVGLANENSIAEGSKLALFSDDTSRLARCTQAAIDTSQHISDPTTSANWHWWLRTPAATSGRYTRHIYTDGTLYRENAYVGHNGVRPLCNLPNTLMMTDSVDGDGCYNFIFETNPVIPVHYGGAWVNSTPYVKHNGVWQIPEVQVKHGGTWKTV